MKRPIHYYSRGYYLLRYYMAFLMARFYRKMEVKGKNNIPKDKPVLFAINHQNALMDALTILQTYKGQPVFMARADIFKIPIVAKALRWLKILPIFRIRDGVKNLQNNDAVFEEAIQVLQDNKRLAILPEGNHTGQHRLRALKKGIARIAFSAEEANDFNLDIQVIPVGLHYFDYIKYDKDLIIEFGEPFSLKSYLPEYKENPQKAMAAFMSDLRAKMLPHMLHVENGEHYNETDAILKCYRAHLKANKPKDSSLIHKRNLEQEKANVLNSLLSDNPDSYDSLAKKAIFIDKEITKLNLRHWVLNKNSYSGFGIAFKALFLLLMLPLFLVGYILNIIPFQLPVYLTRKVKDPQFLSSLRFGYSLVIYPLYYLILFGIYSLVISPWWVNLLVLASTPLIGKLSYLLTIVYKRNLAKCKANRIARKDKNLWNSLRTQYNEILAALS